MTRAVSVGLALVAGMVLLLAAMCVLVLDFDRAGWTGAAIGAGLGLVNFAAGFWVTRRSLTGGLKSAMGTLLGGFFVRMVLLVVLVFLFHKTEAVSEAAQ